jgi:hypothetical protein
VKRTLLMLLAVTCMLAASTAEAKRRRRPRKAKPAATAPADDAIVIGDGGGDAADPGAKTSTKGKDKVFDFTGLSIEGKLRTPQLLYFLGRARQELERAALESRSFIPEMVRSIEEEGL